MVAALRDAGGPSWGEAINLVFPGYFEPASPIIGAMLARPSCLDPAALFVPRTGVEMYFARFDAACHVKRRPNSGQRWRTGTKAAAARMA